MTSSANPSPDVEGQSSNNENAARVSFSNNNQSGCDANENNNGETGGDYNGGDNDSSSSSPPTPLYNSSRLKGYTTLFVSALYNYMAARDKFHQTSLELPSLNLCLAYDDLANLIEIPIGNPSRLRYAMACSLITV